MNPTAYAEMACVQAGHWWYAGRRDILREQLRALALPAGASILEVGCGTGANLALLAEFGDVSGLEMEPRAIALARAAVGPREDVQLVPGRCPEDLDRLGRRFDLVCLFDVLEHIEDDVAALARLRDVLAPGGRLLLTVPACAWMWGPHDEHFHHHRRYSRRSLVRTCEAAGLAVERTGHFNTLLFPLAVAGRLVERASGRLSGATRIPARPVNAALRRIFAAERHVAGRAALPFGLSLLLVAHPAGA